MTKTRQFFFGNKRLNENVAQFRSRDRFHTEMLERKVTVLNKLGLHARPAAEFVRAARTFQSTVYILKNGDTYSGASILDVLSANLDCGSVVLIRVEGPDAETALEYLCSLMEEFKRQEEQDGMG